METNLAALRKNMRLLRNHYGLSQEELAYNLHLTRTTYSAYESGSKIPDLQTIDSLCSFYDMSFDCLVYYDLTEEHLLRQIYCSTQKGDIASLVNDYLYLSTTSKHLIIEQMLLLKNQETLFNREFFNSRSGLNHI